MKNDEKLIQLVSCHEELYDLGNKNYFDAALKNRRWEHIATVLNKKGKLLNSWLYFLLFITVFSYHSFGLVIDIKKGEQSKQ